MNDLEKELSEMEEYLSILKQKLMIAKEDREMFTKKLDEVEG
ncbi:MAG: hypothetical protein AMDU3_IPLC00004G0346 [Thermoplasmatales archaeon I-plasma]|jgi:hypothetical protein|nr:MAG: hypothetical protein AMDU3_IPLC00004G0346 [Thermoplasmatales archaeon I-plasma]